MCRQLQKNFFGIDFGTTHSAAVRLIDDEAGERTVIYDENDYPIPSMLAIHKESGEILFGRKVRERQRELSKEYEVFSSIKLILGEDIQWKIAGKIWTPELIAGQLLRGIKEFVYQKDGLFIDEAVIAIPVDFTPTQRRVLKKAASYAGIEVSKFITEPTAAYFRNYNRVKGYSKVAVFDWGGGTLDISILENKNGKIYELAVAGDRQGGDDIDLAIADSIHNALVGKTNIKIPFSEMADEHRDMLIYRAEEAKKALSYIDSKSIPIIDYGAFGDHRYTLDIDNFTNIVRPMVDRALAFFDETIQKAGISLEQLGCILMVGGSSELRPLLEQVMLLWENKGVEIIYPERGQWSVAEGAAMMAGNDSGYRLNEDIGLILCDNSFYHLFKKDQKIPVEKSPINFAIVEDSLDARFVFADGNKKAKAHLTVPAKGFLNEYFNLKSRIDNDLIATVEVKSDMMPENYKQTVELRGLKFYYDIEGIKEVKTSGDIDDDLRFDLSI